MEPINKRFNPSIQQQRQYRPEGCPTQQSPAAGHSLAAHSKKRQCARFADRLNPKPDAQDEGDHRDH